MRLALAASAVAGAAWTWWRPFRLEVDGASMRPTYEPGDWLVATRRGRIRVGSVVVIEHPQRPGFELIKRIAGTKGEPTAGAYWLVGDNSDESTDSRTFGPVRADAVRGVVRFRYSPFAPAPLASAGMRLVRSILR